MADADESVRLVNQNMKPIESVQQLAEGHGVPDASARDLQSVRSNAVSLFRPDQTESAIVDDQLAVVNDLLTFES